MEKSDDGVIVTAEEAKALYEIYLSGFVSGAVSMAVTAGADPYWVKDVLREDMAERGGRPIDAITDAYIMNEFSARHISPQFVYDWQEQNVAAVAFPLTFQMLLYPAGTFVKGTSDVITLNAVYDAASLATNIYTALFFEQGLLVANLCNEARLITVPVCASGKTGLMTSAVCGAA